MWQEGGESLVYGGELREELASLLQLGVGQPHQPAPLILLHGTQGALSVHHTPQAHSNH